MPSQEKMLPKARVEAISLALHTAKSYLGVGWTFELFLLFYFFR